MNAVWSTWQTRARHVVEDKKLPWGPKHAEPGAGSFKTLPGVVNYPITHGSTINGTDALLRAAALSLRRWCPMCKCPIRLADDLSI